MSSGTSKVSLLGKVLFRLQFICTPRMPPELSTPNDEAAPAVVALPEATVPKLPTKVVVPPTGTVLESPFTANVTGVNVLFLY